MGAISPVLGDGVSTMVPGISERSNGVTRFSHLDRLGTNARTTDAGANVVDSKQYDAFGLPTSFSNPSNSQAGFASAFGIQEDSETGLKLMGHRYYDPGTGRFITRDPAHDGLNWYAYCDNNPLSDVDPEGLSATWLFPDMVKKGKGRGRSKGKGRRHPASKDPAGEAIVENGIALTLAAVGLGTLAIGGGAEAVGDAAAAAGKFWETPQYKKQKAFRDGSPHRLPKGTDAHHLIPKSKKWRRLIEDAFGPDSDSVIDDPVVNSWPWEKDSHRAKWREYDKRLEAIFNSMSEDSTIAELIEKAKWLTEHMKKGL